MSGFVKLDENGLRKVTLAQRVGSFLAVCSLAIYSSFLMDIGLFGLTTIYKNPFFDVGGISLKIAFNFCLLIPFFIQHLMQSRNSFKLSIQKIWVNYVFYERILFNTAASLCLTPLILLWQSDNTVVFEITNPFLSSTWIFMWILGFIFFGWSVLDMGENDIFSFGLLKHFKKMGGSSFPAFVEVKTQSFLRSSCRHPLYGAIFLLNVFGPSTYTITRIQLQILLCTLTYVGASLEEKDLREIPGYDDYIKTVPNQFIPDIRKWFK